MQKGRGIDKTYVGAIPRYRDLRHESPLPTVILLICILATVLFVMFGVLRAQESKKEEEPLELPDVIVYGAETGFRDAGQKLSLVQLMAPATPLNEVDPYPPFPSSQYEYSLPSIQQVVSGLSTSLSAYVGPYSSWGLQAAHNSTLKRARLRLFANLEGTNGEFDNSGGTWGEIEGRIIASLSNKIVGGLQAGYRRWSYGLYGTTLYDPLQMELYDSERTIGKSRHEIMSIDSYMNYMPSENISSRLRFAFQRLTFSPDFYFERYENFFQSDFSVVGSIGPVRIISDVEWKGSHPSIEDITPPQDVNLVVPDYPSSGFLSLNVMARIPFIPQFSADLGGDLQVYSRDGCDDRTRFFPRVKFIYRPLSPVAIFSSIGGSFRYHSMASLLEENPYADPMITSTAEEIRRRMEAGVEVQVIPALLLRGVYRYEKIHDELYWRWSYFIRTYTELNMDVVRQHHFDVSASYQPDDKAKVEAGVSFLDYDVEDYRIPISDQSPEIPFRPRSQAWGTIEYNIPGIFDVRSDWKWVGKRTSFLPLFFDSFNGTLELDSYFLMNLTLEKQIRHHITLFTTFYNLLNSEYEVWYDYPEMGLTIHGGVKVVF